MTCHIIEINSLNILTHNKYYKWVTYKTISYKIFQNVLHISRDLVIQTIVLLILQKIVLTTLNSKTAFEKTNDMLSNHAIWIWCIYIILYFYFVKTFNIYMPKGSEGFNQLI